MEWRDVPVGDAVERGAIHYSAILIGASVLVAPLIAAAEAGPLLAITAGDRLAQALRANTVAIRAEWSEDQMRTDGFGFIVGVDDRFTYVVTADHVIRGYSSEAPADRLTVRFYGQRQAVSADVVAKHDPSLDIGVIRISGAPPIPWFRPVSGAQIATPRGTLVWFVGRSGTWYTPTQPGTVNSIDPALGLVVEGLSVTVGTSGAPLVSKSGDRGADAYRCSGDLSRACPIADVRRKLIEWKVPWQLLPPDIRQWPAGAQSDAMAMVDAARLFARTGRHAEAAEVAQRVSRRAPQNIEVAELLLSSSVRGPWRLCFLAEPNACDAEHPYLQDARQALARIQKDASRSRVRSVWENEVRLLRMLGKTVEADRRAEEGLKVFSGSTWLSAEVGAARARAGDPSGLSMISAAEAAEPSEPLFLLYSIDARLNLGRPIEAAERAPSINEGASLYRRFKSMHSPLALVLSRHMARRVWRSLFKLNTAIESDKTGQRFDYAKIDALMNKHQYTAAGHTKEAQRLRAIVGLRLGRKKAAIEVAKRYLTQLGGLHALVQRARNPASSLRPGAASALRFYHQVLLETGAHPEQRHVIERYADIDLPSSVGFESWPADPFPIEDESAQEVSAIAIVSDGLFVASDRGVRRWYWPDPSEPDRARSSQLKPGSFISTDKPVCALSANDDAVAFVTTDGRAFVWRKTNMERLSSPTPLRCTVAVHADGLRVAAVDTQNRPRFWSGTEDGRLGSVLPAAAEGLAWVGDRLVVTTNDEFIEVSADGKPAQSISCGDDAASVRGRGIDPASGRVVVSTPTGVTVCSVMPNAPEPKFMPVSGLDDESHALALFEGGVVVKPISKRPILREMSRRRQSSLSMRGVRDWSHLAASPSGDTIAAWSLRARTLYALRLGPRRRRRKEIARVLHADRLLAGVSVDPDLRYVATAWRSGRRFGGATVDDFQKRKRVCSVVRLSDERRPMLRGGAQVLQLRRIRGRSSILYDADCRRRSSVANGWVSPSGKWVASRKGQRLVVRSAFDKSTLSTYPCELSALTTVAFSRDETKLVAADAKTLCFIERATNTVRKRPYQVRFDGWLIDGAQDAAISADGQEVIAADELG
ncbi:MAG: serine protease, partial [Myxococcota bacterium]